MYSPVRSFPQALHLKQARCQCLSRATKDWPFLISEPQFPQSVRRKSNLQKLRLPHPPGLAGDPPSPAHGGGQPHSWTIKSLSGCVCVPAWKIKPVRLRGCPGAPPLSSDPRREPGPEARDQQSGSILFSPSRGGIWLAQAASISGATSHTLQEASQRFKSYSGHRLLNMKLEAEDKANIRGGYFPSAIKSSRFAIDS